MNKTPNSYSFIITDYFTDFRRCFSFEGLFFSIIIILYCIDDIIESPLNPRWLYSLPIILTMVCSSFHKISLPMIMYLVPYTQREREAYIEKMLHVKIIFPLLIALACDFILMFIQPLHPYPVILQLLFILFVSYIFGTMNNDGLWAASKANDAYGELQYFVELFLIICYIYTPVHFIICSSQISSTEFIIVLVVMLLIFVPIVCTIRKHWHELRTNFATYAVAIQ